MLTNDAVDGAVDGGAPRRRLKLADGVRIEFGQTADDSAVARWETAALPLGALTLALRNAVHALADGVDEDDVASEVGEREGLQALARWSWLMQALLDVGALRCTLLADGSEPLATISALAPGPSLHLTPPSRSETLALSRFACLRAIAGVATLESPLGRARVELHDPRLAAVIASLALPSTAERLAASTGLAVEALAAFLGFLRGACALAPADESAIDADACGLPFWEVPDALFHVHSRLGRRGPAYGATYRFRGRSAPPPAVAPVTGRIIPLPAPDLSVCATTDRSFTAVLEARRSQRSFSPEPVDVSVLSEFLYRSARNTGLAAQPIADGAEAFTRITRPYPGAGGCHPIEIYLVAHRCSRLERGLYRYEPAGHGLIPLAADATRLDALLASARNGAGAAESPPTLIILAARFARIQWKYEGIGYANLLKDAGALLQTMYLAATAMGLAPCAIGGGDAENFAIAAGRSFWEESSVAEFMLGHVSGSAS